MQRRSAVWMWAVLRVVTLTCCSLNEILAIVPRLKHIRTTENYSRLLLSRNLERREMVVPMPPSGSGAENIRGKKPTSAFPIGRAENVLASSFKSIYTDCPEPAPGVLALGALHRNLVFARLTGSSGWTCFQLSKSAWAWILDLPVSSPQRPASAPAGQHWSFPFRRPCHLEHILVLFFL